MLFAVLALADARSAEAPAKVTFADHVQPILRAKCASCHNHDKPSGGLIMENYTTLLEGGSSGAVIKPGDPDGSKLYVSMAHKAMPFMPPKSPPLPKETAEVIRQWIAGGALDTAASKPAAPTAPKTDIGLKAIVKGKPDGPPPMPPSALPLDPLVRTLRANSLTALASNPWSPLLAVSGQKQVILYHADTGDVLGVLSFPEGQINVLKFSRNGSLLLAAGGRAGQSGKVVVWSVATGQRVVEVGDEHDAVLAADISADQTQIALGGPSKMIRIYSTKDGKKLFDIKKHTDWVTALEYSPDGVLLATGDRNGGLFVWESYTAREYFTLRGHTAAITEVSWRADSNVLLSASEDTTLRLWEMENGSQIKSWGAHGGGVQSAKFGKDGRIVSCGRDLVTKIWDGNGAQQKAFEAFPDVALRATFSHDGSHVIAGDWSGHIRVWNAADGKLTANLTSNPLPVADRLVQATKDVEAKHAAYNQAVATASASQSAAVKAAADLAAAQKAIGATALAAKAAADNATKAKSAADQANAAAAGASATAVAKDVVAKAYAEAAAKVKDAADKAKDNKDLAAAAMKSRELATQAANESAAAQKSAADLATAAKTFAAQLAAAQQAATTAASVAAAAPKAVEALTTASKAAAAKAAADKAAVDQAAAALAAAKAQTERLKAVTVAATSKK